MSKRTHQRRLLRQQQNRRRTQMLEEKPTLNIRREMIQLDLPLDENHNNTQGLLFEELQQCTNQTQSQ